MAWIETHQALRDHPKVSDLAALMNWERYATIGRLLTFWWWCVDYAEDGDLRRHNDVRIGAAVGLNDVDARQNDENPTNSTKFVSAMIKAGFIDKKPYRRVHDWWDYIGNYLQSKYKRTPEKWQKVRSLYLSCTGYNTGAVRVTQPDTNLPTYQPNNQPTKLTNPPTEQPHQTLINRFLDLKAVDRSHKEAVTEAYKRYSRVAVSLLKQAGGIEPALAALERGAKQFDAKNLTWTLDTIAKHLPNLTKEAPDDGRGLAHSQRSLAAQTRRAPSGTEQDRAERHRQLDALTESVDA